LVASEAAEWHGFVGRVAAFTPQAAPSVLFRLPFGRVVEEAQYHRVVESASSALAGEGTEVLAWNESIAPEVTSPVMWSPPKISASFRRRRTWPIAIPGRGMGRAKRVGLDEVHELIAIVNSVWYVEFLSADPQSERR